MIISASRRTDIPGFYMPWMLGRLRAGWCRVVNPFNSGQQRLVSLAPEDIDALVFWTRAPRCLRRAMPEIRALGHERVAAMITLTGYGGALEPHVPGEKGAIRAFHELAELLGRDDALRWRYDPILLGPDSSLADHRRRFARLARSLQGATRVVLVSFVDLYGKTRRRLSRLGLEDVEGARPGVEPARRLVRDLAAIASGHGMSLRTCAEEHSFHDEGAPAGRCIDPDWLGLLFPGRSFEAARDPGQRARCGCAPAIDIGMPDTCLHGCAYCYAVRGHEAALARHARHDPLADALLPVERRGTPRVLGSVPPRATV